MIEALVHWTPIVGPWIVFLQICFTIRYIWKTDKVNRERFERLESRVELLEGKRLLPPGSFHGLPQPRRSPRNGE